MLKYLWMYLEKGKKCKHITNIKVKIFDQVYEDIIYFIFIFDGKRDKKWKPEGKKVFCGDYAKLIPNLCVLSFVCVAVCGVNIAKHLRNVR